VLLRQPRLELRLSISMPESGHSGLIRTQLGQSATAL